MPPLSIHLCAVLPRAVSSSRMTLSFKAVLGSFAYICRSGGVNSCLTGEKPRILLPAAASPYTSKGTAGVLVLGTLTNTDGVGFITTAIWGITDLYFPVTNTAESFPYLMAIWTSWEKGLVKCFRTRLGFIELLSGYCSWGNNLETSKMFIKWTIRN